MSFPASSKTTGKVLQMLVAIHEVVSEVTVTISSSRYNLLALLNIITVYAYLS